MNKTRTLITLLSIGVFLSANASTNLTNAAYSVSSKIVSSFEDRFTADAILGYWLHEDNVVKIQMEKIGRKYYGKMVWIEKPNFPDGTLKTDKFNPDPELRDVPFVGLRIVKDLEYKGNGTWGGGTLYDPEHGKTFGCKITLDSEEEAIVRGYIGFAFIGKSVRFTRVNG
ncbi:MAG: DUF2147 domain-containing protein [Candidatus Competibacteraceae bacterium]|nr:DUF2147 domain-containing protein [Candidatus Competibacteraceae bacterium]